MEAGPDASICNFVGEGRHVGPTVSDTWCRRTCHRDLGNIVRTERGLNDSCNAAVYDAMGARVFRVQRRLGDRLPTWLAIRGRVTIDIAVTNCRDRPPEIVMVLGVQNRDECVVDGNASEGHKPRAIYDIHPLGNRELSQEGEIGHWTGDEPEACGLGLLWRSDRALLCAIALDLVEVFRPFRAIEWNRRAWPELGRTRHCEWLEGWPHWGPHDRRRHIDARRCPRPVVIGCVGAVLRPRLQDLRRNGLAELDAFRFRRTIGDRRKIVGEIKLHLSSRFCIYGREDRSSSSRCSSFLRRARVHRLLC